jgi:hypothetical protein
MSWPPGSPRPTDDTAPAAKPNESVPEGARAICRDCGADIQSWRARVLPLDAAAFAVTEAGQLALHVERRGACVACGGGRVEIRVEG